MPYTAIWHGRSTEDGPHQRGRPQIASHCCCSPCRLASGTSSSGGSRRWRRVGVSQKSLRSSLRRRAPRRPAPRPGSISSPRPCATRRSVSARATRKGRKCRASRGSSASDNAGPSCRPAQAPRPSRPSYGSSTRARSSSRRSGGSGPRSTATCSRGSGSSSRSGATHRYRLGTNQTSVIENFGFGSNFGSTGIPT